MTEAIDEARLEEYMGRLGAHMTGSALCLGIWLGDELGFYQALRGAGPLDAAEVAAKTGCHPRLVREWLDSQAAGGLIDYDAAQDRYELSPEGAAALADDTSVAFVARGMNVFASMYTDKEKIADAIRGDGALSWGEHHPCLFVGTEWFFRTGYRAALPSWIDGLEGVTEKLAAGGTVADVGCGHGASANVLAESFPAAQITGFDFHAPSIEIARDRAKEAGVGDRVAFDVADAKGYPGSYDLICFFDCLHDMGDPVGIASYAREHLNPGGTVLLVEPFAMADRAVNMAENPVAAMLYMASTAICTPNSLSQEVGRGIGAQAGQQVLEEVLREAGFGHVRKVAETPINLILEVRV